MIYIVENNNKVVGVWDTFDDAKSFVLGCYQNNFINLNNVVIKTYQLNNCLCLDTTKINNPNVEKVVDETSIINHNNITLLNESSKIKTESSLINHNDPAVIHFNNVKIDLQHNINLLKQQKKKIEESKNTFNSDYNMFQLFAKNKLTDDAFIIPEIFVEKFELMSNLNNENKLTWENFIKEFSHNNLYNEYFGLNVYEKTFIDEEIDI
jgi:hypothetical protein